MFLNGFIYKRKGFLDMDELMSVPQTDKDVEDFIFSREDFGSDEKNMLWKKYQGYKRSGMDVQAALGELLSEMYCY